MNKKRVIAVISAIAVIATLAVGCSKKTSAGSNTKEKTTTSKKSDVKVGLTTDEGGLNDKSFNQSANEGINKAKNELGFQYSALESHSSDDYEPNLTALVQNGSKLVFGVGYQMEEAIKKAAKSNPDTKFVIIDSPDKGTNLSSITFKENEGSFLVGVIAGKMTKTNKVGFIGGKDQPTINKFEYGFIAGVESVNPAAAKDLIARKTSVYVDSFQDPQLGKTQGKNLINAGCDVIYHAAGGVGVGMFQAIQDANKSGKKVWGIGVDMDQYKSLPKYKDIILTSMMKRVDNGTYMATKDFINGSLKSNQVTVLGLKEGGVDVAPSSSVHTPKAVLDLVDKYKKAVIDGKITVPATKADIQAFKPVTIK
ncbi:BMP family lipoprotein [Clostridium oryzae]|uniref:Membrane lipoprotein TmpC n=1 Tax=Clostridium oryzae TaxID=1450648 RepID=A0A1V4IKN8_9CLOT|nr:BMP family ABC transporter substrate-binding protein [Clostridium oryzae]OPJ60496.1 membrane lipoprotein TmpC precursor [Clostridium oryzae]